MNPITILITDDHKLVRESWTYLLNKDSRFRVLATCDTAESAIESVKNLEPEVILLDINLPGMGGIEAVPMILQASPKSKVIGVSMHSAPGYARKMMQEGACGYVTKDSSKAELIEAILAVQNGHKFLCRNIKISIAEQFIGNEVSGSDAQTLSTRELEITELLKDGLSSKEIAGKLSISTKTVEVHRYNILKKLNLKNTAALINFIGKHH